MTDGYEWLDETHDSVDDFIAAVRGEPPEAQMKALSIYSSRRTGESDGHRLADDLRATAKPLSPSGDVVDVLGRRWRPVGAEKGLRAYVRVSDGSRPRKRLPLRAFYGLLWLANPNVILLVAASVGLWFALNWAAK